MKNTNVEVEGGELLIQSKEGHYAVIPAKERQGVINMVNENCDDCINKYIQTLPKEADYAEDGSLISGDNKKLLNYIPEPYVAEQDNVGTGYSQQAELKFNATMHENQKEKDYQKAVKTLDDTEFREKYDTSPHRYKYDTDSAYKAKAQEKAKITSKEQGAIDFPSTDSRSKNYTGNPNLGFMNPNKLKGEAVKANEEFHMNVIGAALPVPGLETMGKIPSVVGASKKLIKPVVKAVTKVDDIAKPITSSVDDVGKGFKSEIDWAKWNADTPKYPELINEYNAIEESAKKAGTWMKNPDGSVFQGTPEQFVQQQSENFKKWFAKSKVVDSKGNPQIVNHNTSNEFDKFDLKHFGQTDNGFSGKGFYFHPDDKELLDFYGDFYGDKSIKAYLNITSPHPLKGKTNFGRVESNYDGVIVPGKTSSGRDIVAEYVTDKPTNIKSAIGNVGFFDMTNPNIYKGLIPAAIGTGAALQNNKTKNKKK